MNRTVKYCLFEASGTALGPPGLLPFPSDKVVRTWRWH